MPIHIVPGESRHLETGNDACFTSPYRSHQASETRARARRRPALALILVDHDDSLSGPAEIRDLPHQVILAPLALQMMLDLMIGRLPNVHECSAREVLGTNLVPDV